MCAESATPRPRAGAGRPEQLLSCAEAAAVLVAASACSQPDSRATVSRHSASPFDAIGWPPNQGSPGSEHVLAPQGDRVHGQACRDLVELALRGEGHLRHAEAAEGTEAQLVRVRHAPVRRARAGSGTVRAHQQRVAQHARAVVAVGAAIEQQLHLARDQRAVGLGARLDADGERMARAHGLEVFLAAQDQLDGALGLDRQQHDAPAARAPPSCCRSRRPTRGVRQRTLVIGRPSDSHTHAWTRNTDWFADHSVIRPEASISASAPTRLERKVGLRLGRVARLDDDVALGPRRGGVAGAKVGARADVCRSAGVEHLHVSCRVLVHDSGASGASAIAGSKTAGSTS